MKKTLETLLPKLGVTKDHVLILEHQGKSDLEESWRRKLPRWNTPGDRFLILRDADGGDCRSLKNQLLQVAEQCDKQDRVSVRIVFQELESWFLGDAQALRSAGYLKPDQNPAQLRNPDKRLKPSDLLNRWKPGHGKISGAQAIARHMNPDNNTSTSFGHTIRTIRSEFAGMSAGS